MICNFPICSYRHHYCQNLRLIFEVFFRHLQLGRAAQATWASSSLAPENWHQQILWSLTRNWLSSGRLFCTLLRFPLQPISHTNDLAPSHIILKNPSLQVFGKRIWELTFPSPTCLTWLTLGLLNSLLQNPTVFNALALLGRGEMNLGDRPSFPHLALQVLSLWKSLETSTGLTLEWMETRKWNDFYFVLWGISMELHHHPTQFPFHIPVYIPVTDNSRAFKLNCWA